jgi:hypothetical protein
VLWSSRELRVANYRMSVTNFPLSLEKKKWSKVETENLKKGIMQQFQATVLQISRNRALKCTAITRCTSSGLGLILTTYIWGYDHNAHINFILTFKKDKKYFQHLQKKLHIFFPDLLIFLIFCLCFMVRVTPFNMNL